LTFLYGKRWEKVKKGDCHFLGLIRKFLLSLGRKRWKKVKKGKKGDCHFLGLIRKFLLSLGRKTSLFFLSLRGLRVLLLFLRGKFFLFLSSFLPFLLLCVLCASASFARK